MYTQFLKYDLIITSVELCFQTDSSISQDEFSLGWWKPILSCLIASFFFLSFFLSACWLLWILQSEPDFFFFFLCLVTQWSRPWWWKKSLLFLLSDEAFTMHPYCVQPKTRNFFSLSTAQNVESYSLTVPLPAPVILTHEKIFECLPLLTNVFTYLVSACSRVKYPSLGAFRAPVWTCRADEKQRVCQWGMCVYTPWWRGVYV